jgi:hypothetical protein
MKCTMTASVLGIILVGVIASTGLLLGDGRVDGQEREKSSLDTFAEYAKCELRAGDTVLMDKDIGGGYRVNVLSKEQAEQAPGGKATIMEVHSNYVLTRHRASTSFGDVFVEEAIPFRAMTVIVKYSAKDSD